MVLRQVDILIAGRWKVWEIRRARDTGDVPIRQPGCESRFRKNAFSRLTLWWGFPERGVRNGVLACAEIILRALERGKRVRRAAICAVAFGIVINLDVPTSASAVAVAVPVARSVTVLAVELGPFHRELSGMGANL